MTALNLPAGSFDAVAAFYSMTHVPRDRHPPLLASVAHWLRPGGLFVASLGANDESGTVDPDWLGAPMYFSHFDAATNRQLVEEAGMEILTAREETAEEFDRPCTFLWVVARRPG